MLRVQTPHVDKSHFKKAVQNYTISYCPKQLLGRSLYGEVRLGFQNNQKRVKAIRINSLPMSEQAKANISLQKFYSQLTNCVRTIHETIQSQSNRYTIMEYFPRTFRTELVFFRKLTKNMEPFIERFLQTYSKLYYYRIAHGNLSLQNIGMTFEGKVKLMDFRSLSHMSFQEASLKDYRDFRNMMCFILERDKVFPSKFETFDDPEGDWEKLFSAWHIVNPYQYIYREKKSPFQNIVVLLAKLQGTIFPDDDEGEESSNKMSDYLRVAVRLLMLTCLHKIKSQSQKVTHEIQQLERLIDPLQHDICFYNSILWGAVNDNHEYKIHQSQRLTLIMCLLPNMNHEYFYIEILKQFEPNKEDAAKFALFSQSLLHHYSQVMIQNLISQT